MIQNLLDLESLLNRKEEFTSNNPFPHLVIDNFLPNATAKTLASEFPVKGDDRLFIYDNPLEVKMALNDWNAYPPQTYQLLQYLNSKQVVDSLSDLLGQQLYPDPGLHGGGWHIHGPGGKLNPHLDYSIHPKLGLQRKLNLIIYLSEDWQLDWGGHLGLWSHNEELKSPENLISQVEIKFNRALLFDTTCNSWHGISRPVTCPAGKSRNSIAVYYLAEPGKDAPSRSRALYAPTDDQQGDEEILDLIRKRSNLKESKKVYRR